MREINVDYVEIITGEKWLTWTSLQFRHGQFIHPIEGEGVGIVILASYKFDYIRVYDNLV